MEEKNIESYGQIAKSTGVYGGSQAIIMLVGILRTKILAVLLGATGVGLVGLYQSVIDLIKSFAGLGLSFSSVKDIAEANSTGDEDKIARTTTVLHRLLWLTGLAGMILMIAFSFPISEYLFGDQSKAWPICLLSFCVLTGILSSGQIALLQGKRRIIKMAKASVYGAVGGFIVAVVFYTWLGIDGIVPTLIVASLLSLVFSWWFSRNEFVRKVQISVKETFRQGGSMVKLGFYTMISGLISTATLFFMKSFMLQVSDIETVGLYQAVWSISFMYLGAILTSMGTDYYPRLCGLNGDNEAMVRFSNEQTRFVLLVTTPIIIFVLLLSSPILQLLYSSEFALAADLMRWQILGTFLKVLIWPVGFFLLAKGKGLRFFIAEFSWFALYYFATRFGWEYFGLESAGIAYLIAYVIYYPLVYFMVKPLCNFRFTNENLLLMLCFLAFTLVAFMISMYLEGWLYWVLAAAIFIITSLLAAYELNRILPAKIWKEKLMKYIRK